MSPVNTKELTQIQTIFTKIMPYLPDPDRVLKKKAGSRGRDFYDEILSKDAHLASCISTRKKAVTKLSWDIHAYVEPGKDEPLPRDQEIAETVKILLGRMDNFNQAKYEILSALNNGYSVGELMFNLSRDGLYYINTIKSRHPDYFKFGPDGELLFRSARTYKYEEVPREKFVAWSFDPRYENPYGTSLLETAFWPHWFKANLIKFMMVFSERYGTPPLVAYYPSGWSKEEVEELIDKLDNLVNKAVIAMPEGTKGEFAEPRSGYEKAYRENVEFFNDEMSKLILGQTLTSSEGRRTGSLALGEVHAEVRMDILESDANDLDHVINRDVVPVLVDNNFGVVDNYPEHVTEFRDPEDLGKDADTYSKLVKVGLPIGLNHVYRKFRIPKPEEGEEILTAPQAPSPFPEFHGRSKPVRFALTERDRAKLIGLLPRGKTFDIAKTMAFYDEFFDYVTSILNQIEHGLLNGSTVSIPMESLIDQHIRMQINRQFGDKMSDIAGRTVFSTAQSFASQFSRQLQESVFHSIKDTYLRDNFYAKGKIDGMASAMRDLLNSKLPDWPTANFDLREMKSMIRSTFKGLKEWKVHQIAMTEMNEAAHYASLEMIEKTGLDFRGYFLVDPQSCDICQEWASRNPYSMDDVRKMGLPHIQCNDQWTYELQEAA